MLQLDHGAKTVVELKAISGPHLFIQLLVESETEHTDLLFHSNDRWLLEWCFAGCGRSRGRGRWRHFWWLSEKLTSLWRCRTQTGCVTWLLGHIVSHLNDFNLKLQGMNVFVYELHSHMQAFQGKLPLFSWKLVKNAVFSNASYPNQVQSAFLWCKLQLIVIQCDPSLKETITSSTLDNDCSLKKTQFPYLGRQPPKMWWFCMWWPKETVSCDQWRSYRRCKRAVAPGPRHHEGPTKEEKKNSCPELPQGPVFVNEIAGAGR